MEEFHKTLRLLAFSLECNQMSRISYFYIHPGLDIPLDFNDDVPLENLDESFDKSGLVAVLLRDSYNISIPEEKIGMLTLRRFVDSSTYSQKSLVSMI